MPFKVGSVHAAQSSPTPVVLASWSRAEAKAGRDRAELGRAGPAPHLQGLHGVGRNRLEQRRSRHRRQPDGRDCACRGRHQLSYSAWARAMLHSLLTDVDDHADGSPTRQPRGMAQKSGARRLCTDARERAESAPSL